MTAVIPRQLLFGDPLRHRGRISPDGTRLAYLAPSGGVLNLWVRTVGADDDRAITADRGAGVQFYSWAEDSRHLLFVQDREGDENWHLHRVSIDGGEAVDLTAIDGVQARLMASHPSQPGAVLVGINDRDPRAHDVYRIEVATGERQLVVKNDFGASTFVADHTLEPRIAEVPTADGGIELRYQSEGSWRTLMTWSGDDAMTSAALGFGPDNRTLYIQSSAGINGTSLRALSLPDGEQTELFTVEDADIDGTLTHPVTGEIQAVSVTRARRSWHALDAGVEEDLRFLDQLYDGDWQVLGRDNADRIWLVVYVDDDGPHRYFAYHRQLKQGRLLFAHRPELDSLPLAEMKPISYRARDERVIHGYLTMPAGADGPVPAVVLVHGGPWYRDHWGFHSEVQWLANRGYAVLQPNFRGSTGYGKEFLNAGDRQWGAAMQDDITDGTRWLIESGIADPDRICMMGSSFGGYATFMGLARQPELYACGVVYAGAANLITWLQNIPSYWQSFRPTLYRRVGHPDKDAAMLEQRSPVFLADSIRAPLFIAHGANDPRVPKNEAMQIVEVLQARGRQVEYLEFDNEGHDLVHPDNRLNFYARAERFLAEHLGGRHEP